jgi:hypothetical protein
MMNLVFDGAGTATLTCSHCHRRWQVTADEPFVPQLRTLLLTHSCDRPVVTHLEDWRALPARMPAPLAHPARVISLHESVASVPPVTE